MKGWRRTAAILAAAGLVFSLPVRASSLGRADDPASPSRKPNILLITIDTLRADALGCYGNAAARTPRIDALAARGVLFNRAFAHTPTTLPSHTNILLGLTPVAHGIHDNANFRVGEGELTLASHLKTYGYATAAFVGAFPLDSRFGLTRGFDVYDDNYGGQSSLEFTYVERKAEAVVGAALRWLEGREGPWFLWVHCFDPHYEYDPPEPFKAEFRDHLYLGEVAYVDFALDKLFGFIRDRGLEKETICVLTGDHGESLGEHGEATHGYFAYNATLRVPLIAAGPRVRPGRVEANVSHVDIFPTVCELCGINKPPALHGRSLVPALAGKKLDEKPIYFESLYPYYSRGWAPLRGLILGNEKYIDSPLPEFYDLARDFGESTNKAGMVKLEPFRARLDDLVKEESSAVKGGAARAKVDKAARDKLQSLGYVSSPQAGSKKNFTEKDDLKTLLPYQNKLMEAMGAAHQGKVEDGIAQLREIAAERTDFDMAYFYLAILLKEQGRLKEAVAVLAEGSRNNPGSFKILSTYGIVLVEAGLFDQAVDVLKRSLALIDFDPDIWHYLGNAYYNKGAFPDALKAYEKALSLDPDFPVVLNNLGALYLTQALDNDDAASLRKAIENFRRAIVLDPGYASAYNGLGGALRRAGDVEGAIASWKKAVELKPDFAFPLFNLGSVFLSLGKKSEALDYFLKYKEKYYSILSPKDKERLDALIQKCR